MTTGQAYALRITDQVRRYSDGACGQVIEIGVDNQKLISWEDGTNEWVDPFWFARTADVKPRLQRADIEGYRIRRTANRLIYAESI